MAKDDDVTSSSEETSASEDTSSNSDESTSEEEEQQGAVAQEDEEEDDQEEEKEAGEDEDEEEEAATSGGEEEGGAAAEEKEPEEEEEDEEEDGQEGQLAFQTIPATTAKILVQGMTEFARRAFSAVFNPAEVDAAMVGVEEVEPLRSVMAAAKMGHLAGRPKPLKDVKQVFGPLVRAHLKAAEEEDLLNERGLVSSVWSVMGTAEQARLEHHLEGFRDHYNTMLARGEAVDSLEEELVKYEKDKGLRHVNLAEVVQRHIAALDQVEGAAGVQGGNGVAPEGAEEEDEEPAAPAALEHAGGKRKAEEEDDKEKKAHHHPKHKHKKHKHDKEDKKEKKDKKKTKKHNEEAAG